MPHGRHHRVCADRNRHLLRRQARHHQSARQRRVTALRWPLDPKRAVPGAVQYHRYRLRRHRVPGFQPSGSARNVPPERGPQRSAGPGHRGPHRAGGQRQHGQGRRLSRKPPGRPVHGAHAQSHRQYPLRGYDPQRLRRRHYTCCPCAVRQYWRKRDASKNVYVYYLILGDPPTPAPAPAPTATA